MVQMKNPQIFPLLNAQGSVWVQTISSAFACPDIFSVSLFLNLDVRVCARCKLW